MLSPNTILQNRYRITRLLGEGGMGAVYEAIDERVSCLVALKETLAGDNDEARRAFLREASLLANLRHPSLPKVMDHFNEGGGLFLVMEHIPGYDLGELIRLRGAPFEIEQVVEWAESILKALEYLHGRVPPIVHRDIKPANLKLTREKEVFLLDFGLAKGTSGEMPTEMEASRSIRAFTPAYAPLEQILGQGTDPRSDIYGLGATLFHLLTMRPPVDASTRFVQVEEGHPDPLPRIEVNNPSVPQWLADVVHRAMAISRRDRTASASEMRSQLRVIPAHAGSEATTWPLPNVTLDSAVGIESKEPALDVPTRKSDEISFAVGGAVVSEPSAAFAPAEFDPVQPITVGSRSAGQTQPTPSFQVAPATGGDRIAVSRLVSFRGGNRLRLLIGAVLGTFLIATSVSLFMLWPQPDAIDPGVVKANSGSVTPVPTVPDGMVFVPGGEFKMGRNEEDGGDEFERPAHTVTVNAFFIDVTEVTCEAYKKCVDEKRCNAPLGWVRESYAKGAGRHPVTGVTWDDAAAYAKWSGKRLPTEEEWEFAARGIDGRLFPWGNEWKAGLANADSASGGLVDVGSFKGASPVGALDMVGNAWEWTATDLRAYPGGKLPDDQVKEGLKVIRSGSYESTNQTATTTYRTGWPVRGASTYAQTGFRCVRDVSK